MDDTITLATLPMSVRWEALPAAWSTEPLRIEAGPGTDLFVDPAGDATYLTAPRLLGTPPEGDFQLSATVSVDFADSFDAGVLLLWADERRWAKLCFELSPQGEPMVVTVVTRGSSDDANAFLVDGGKVRLRISRVGPAFAFHASVPSPSGSAVERWSFVRYFDLGAEGVRVGFEAQSPTGKGSAATFEDIRFVPERLVDLRDGS
jgi:regulation of enolase protein 1 (concanavalin A-like superfamily)